MVLSPLRFTPRLRAGPREKKIKGHSAEMYRGPFAQGIPKTDDKMRLMGIFDFDSDDPCISLIPYPTSPCSPLTPRQPLSGAGGTGFGKAVTAGAVPLPVGLALCIESDPVFRIDAKA